MDGRIELPCQGSDTSAGSGIRDGDHHTPGLFYLGVVQYLALGCITEDQVVPLLRFLPHRKRVGLNDYVGELHLLQDPRQILAVDTVTDNNHVITHDQWFFMSGKHPPPPGPAVRQDANDVVGQGGGDSHAYRGKSHGGDGCRQEELVQLRGEQARLYPALGEDKGEFADLSQ